MALTQEQINAARTRLGITAPTDPSHTNRAQELDSAWGTTSTDKPSIVSNYLNDVKEGAKAGASKVIAGVKEATPHGNLNPLNLVEGVGKILGGATEAITSPIAPAFKPVGKAIDIVTKPISDNKAVQKFAQSPAGEATSRVAQSVSDYSNAAGLVAGAAGGGPKAASAVKKTVDSVASKADTPLAAPARAVNDNAAFDAYQRAVKPTISGKGTLGATEKYKADTLQARNSIIENKPNLKFTTEDGTVESGRTPQTRAELAQAVDQTKKSIFAQYDSVAKQAGEQGAHVSLEPVAAHLDSIITNKALQVSHPEAIKYAQDLKARFAQAKLPDGSPVGYKVFDAKTTQDLIQNYNTSLESFYRNPSYETASRAAIDALVVRNLREGLDQVIENTTGAHYQGLKNQYAALKTIEADVNKSANRAARINNKGLADYTDIFSGGDIVAGLVTLNPALFAKGVAQHGFKEWLKHLNNPDRAIGKFFGDDQLSSQASNSPKATLPTNTPTADPAATSINTSIGDKVPPPSRLASNPVNRGMVKVPLIPKKIPAEDLATMSDFTDYVAGTYGSKMTPQEISSLEQEAADLWDKHLQGAGKRPVTLKGMANDFGRALEKNNFAVKPQPRDPKTQRYLPHN